MHKQDAVFCKQLLLEAYKERTMKFICLSGAEADKEALRKEYRETQRWGEARIGKEHLFYRSFIKIKYVSINEIERIYIREESGESGEFLLLESYLMIKTKDGVLHKLRIEWERNAHAVLFHIKNNYPLVAVGFDGSNEI